MFQWFHFLSYAVITTATPGPNNIMSMSNAGRYGFRRSFPFNLGIWCGFSIVMLICTFFCNTLSGVIPKIKTPMLIAGAAYMLYLAWAVLGSLFTLLFSRYARITNTVMALLLVYCAVSLFR